MAILTSKIEFTGSIGDLSAYKRRDLEKTILRGKGGGNKAKIYNSPSCQNTRDNFTEFSLCGKMGGCIRRSLTPLSGLADYNFTSQLTSIAKIIQKLDLESEKGKRNIILSQNKHLLPGFSLNRKISFESIVKPSLSYEINREESSASIRIPELMPGVNFINPKAYSFYRFIINLGCVSDKFYSANLNFPKIEDQENYASYSSWCSSLQPADAEELTVKLRWPEKVDKNATYILSLGIQFGTPLSDQLIQPVKYAGAAKILGVA